MGMAPEKPEVENLAVLSFHHIHMLRGTPFVFPECHGIRIVLKDCQLSRINPYSHNF
jgi:hypothetical protein